MQSNIPTGDRLNLRNLSDNPMKKKMKKSAKKVSKPGDKLMAFKAKYAAHEAKEKKTGKPAKKLTLGRKAAA